MEKKEQTKKIDKKKLNTILCILIGIGIVVIVGILIYNAVQATVPSGYKAVFVGEKDKVEYKTYIYKLENDEENYGFKYVDTTDGKITKKGRAHWTEDVLKAARENNAQDYVLEDDKKYTIDEYTERFMAE